MNITPEFIAEVAPEMANLPPEQLRELVLKARERLLELKGWRVVVESNESPITAELQRLN